MQTPEPRKPIGDVILEVKDLKTHLFTKRGIVKAVDGVSFSLRQGETLGIVGESGSGKSMTALSLLGLEPKPAARIVGGEIWYKGENLATKSDKEMRKIRGRMISLILQDPQSSLNPVLSIGDQVTEAFRVHGSKTSKQNLVEKAVGVLRSVCIAAPERRISDYPHQMSGGMKQRVVGAIAISCEPQIVIADEPTTSLDLTIQAQYLRLLRDIQEQTGISIIFITHDFGIVAKMCDRVAVMYAGRVVEHGPVRDIFNRPSHPYTNALINSVPTMESRAERLYTIPGQPPTPWDLPPGCPFASRCEYMEERCRVEYPSEFLRLSGSETHAARCWKLEDLSWAPVTYSR